MIIRTSFEGIGDSVFENEEEFCSDFLQLMIQSLRFTNKDECSRIQRLKTGVKNLQMLSGIITEFVSKSEKSLILIIDEIDKATNNQLFLSFLEMIRNKYILASDDRDYTFHSVILAGVHDIKNFKLKLKPDEERKYNSPWNIAVNFDIDMTFNVLEIGTMLKEYAREENVHMDTLKIAEKIYYYTSGYQ